MDVRLYTITLIMLNHKFYSVYPIMKLTEKQKEQIKTEYHNWFESAYGNKSLEERRELDAFPLYYN